MNRFFSMLLFFVFSVCLYADIIDLIPKTSSDWIDLIDQERLEEAKERAKNNNFFATWLYFIGGDEDYYTGSLYQDNDELLLKYFPPGQEGYFENGASIMAYTINKDIIELILKKWTWSYTSIMTLLT